MNYRHIYHAGNFADIVKHLVLIAILEQLKNKDKPFAVLDSFAGVGLYDLTSEAASKTLESNTGIGKLLQATDPIPELLKTFLSIITTVGQSRVLSKVAYREEFVGDTKHSTEAINVYEDAKKLPLEVELGRNFSHYPGSPFIITQLLRPQDRLIACELHPTDYLSLKKLLPNAHNVDAYNAIKAFLPFKENRGLIFLDPPFEVKNEFEKLVVALKQIKLRALNNPILIWYPIKNLSIISDFYHNYKNIGFKETLIIEYELVKAVNYKERGAKPINNRTATKDDVSECKSFGYSDKNMVKCGLMLINPPNIKKELDELTTYLSNTINLKFTYIDF